MSLVSNILIVIMMRGYTSVPAGPPLYMGTFLSGAACETAAADLAKVYSEVDSGTRPVFKCINIGTGK